MKLPHPAKKARLELASMLDVIFIVLIFLVYAMLDMTVSKGTEINLPASATARPLSAESVSLTVFANGEVEMQNKKISLDNLAKELSQMAAELPEQTQTLIRIFAVPQLEYQKLYQTLDAVKLAGFSRVSLQAK